MYLFIFESIGTSELLLIGLVALIFLGPRKMPEMARKIGKMMAEFKTTTSEFKETWQREVNFEEEAKAFNLNILEAEPVKRAATIESSDTGTFPDAPAIKEMDPAAFEHLKTPKIEASPSTKKTTLPDDTNDKKNWL